MFYLHFLAFALVSCKVFIFCIILFVSDKFHDCIHSGKGDCGFQKCGNEGLGQSCELGTVCVGSVLPPHPSVLVVREMST